MRRTKRARRRLLAVIGFALVLGVGLGTFRVIRNIQSERLTQEAREIGMQAYEDGDLELALDKLSTYFVREKEDLDAIVAFADVRSRIPTPNNRHMAEAVILYEQHVLPLIEGTLDTPEHLELRRDLLRRVLQLRAALGMRVELLETAERLLHDVPDDIEALNYKAQALAAERRFDEAIPVIERLIELESGSLMWRQMLLGVMRSRDGTSEPLLALCDRWNSEDPADGRYHLLKAELEAQTGDFAAARADALLATEQGPATQEVLGRLVSVLDRLELRDDATELIVLTQEREPDALWVREATVRRFWLGDQVAEAVTVLDEVEAGFDDIGNPLRRLRIVLMGASNREEELAATLAELRVKGDEEDVAWADAIEAWLAMDQDNWSDVLATVSIAHAVDPTDPVINYVLGQSFHAAGERSRAIRSYERAAILEPNWVTAAAVLTEELLAAGRVGEAYTAARDLLRRAPGRHLNAHLIFCRAYLAVLAGGTQSRLIDRETGGEVDVTELLARLHDNVPDHVEIAGLLAEAYAATGRPRVAEDFIREVAGREDVSSDMLVALANVSRRRGLEMEDDLLSSIERGDETDALIAARARAWAASGELERAVTALRARIGEHTDGEFKLRETLIDLLRAEGEPSVLDECKAMVARDSDRLSTHLYVLAVPRVWTDETFSRSVIDRLTERLGDQSQQVRLSDARWKLAFNGDDDAQLAEAIVAVGDVLEESPQSLSALTTMAAALQLGPSPDVPRAIRHLEEVIALYPGEAGACIQLIALKQREGDFGGAQRYLDHLSRIAGHRTDLKRARIELLRQQGDFETARFEAGALAAETSEASDALVLAAMHQRVGRMKDAERIYVRLLEGAPDRLVMIEAADFYARTGRFDEGLELVEAVEIDGGEAAHAYLLGAFCERHGRFDRAMAWWTEATKRDPTSAEAFHRLARQHLARKSYTEARRAALAAVRLDESNQGARMTLVLSSLSGDAAGRREAIEELEQLAEHQELIDSLRVLDACTVNGEIQPATDHLRRARELIELHDHFLPAWFLAIMLHVEAGRLDDAAEIARRAVGRFPMSVEPSQWATRVLVDSARWSDALIESEEWRRRTLHDPLDADLSIAAILLELERPDDAVHQLRVHEQRLLGDERFEPIAVYIEALLRAGEFDDAMALLAPRLEGSGYRELALAVAPDLDEEQGRALLTELEQSITAPAERLVMAARWSILGRNVGCEACFDRAEEIAGPLRDEPRLQIAALALLASIGEMRGDDTAAEARYREIIAKAPEHAIALNNLAAVLVRNGRNEEEALAFVERALGAHPDQPDFLDTQAMALMRLDRYAEAEVVLRQALTSRPNDLDIGMNLVEALVRSGQYEDAGNKLREIERRLEQRPNDDRDRRIRFEGLQQEIRQASAAVSG